MEWGFYVLGAAVAAGLGYVGGHVALLTGRSRPEPALDPPVPAAAFRLEHRDGHTWTLVNVGDAPGVLVRLVPLVDGLEQWPPPVAGSGQVETAMSELLPTLAPGEAMSVWFSRYDPGQEAIVSWTAESNVQMGPVRLSLPPPR